MEKRKYVYQKLVFTGNKIKIDGAQFNLNQNIFDICQVFEYNENSLTLHWSTPCKYNIAPVWPVQFFCLFLQLYWSLGHEIQLTNVAYLTQTSNIIKLRVVGVAMNYLQIILALVVNHWVLYEFFFRWLFWGRCLDVSFWLSSFFRNNYDCSKSIKNWNVIIFYKLL